MSGGKTVRTLRPGDILTLTLLAMGRRDEGLEQRYDAGQAPLYLSVLGLDGFLCAKGDLEILVWLLGGKLPDTSLEVLDLSLGPLADCPLSFSV